MVKSTKETYCLLVRKSSKKNDVEPFRKMDLTPALANEIQAYLDEWNSLELTPKKITLKLETATIGPFTTYHTKKMTVRNLLDFHIFFTQDWYFNSWVLKVSANALKPKKKAFISKWTQELVENVDSDIQKDYYSVPPFMSIRNANGVKKAYAYDVHRFDANTEKLEQILVQQANAKKSSLVEMTKVDKIDQSSIKVCILPYTVRNYECNYFVVLDIDGTRVEVFGSTENNVKLAVAVLVTYYGEDKVKRISPFEN